MVRIDISNRALLVYGVFFILFLSIGFGIAYRSGESPSVMGHSAEELEVDIDGAIKTLQGAINGGDFSGECYLLRASNCPTTTGYSGWHPSCPPEYTKKGWLDPLQGTGVNWCRISITMCCK